MKGSVDMKKINFNAAKLLPIAAVGLSILSTVLDNKRQANDRKALKAELKNEMLKELLADEN